MSTYDDTFGVGILVAMFAGLFFFWLILAVGGYVLTSLFMMKVFDKAGVQGRWRAWIPFYNSMVFMKLGDVNPWLIFFALASFIPYLNIIGWLGGVFVTVMMIIAAYRIGLKLQKDGAWVVLYIFLAPVWLGICAFDGSRWNHQVPPPSWAGNGFLGDRTRWSGIPSSGPGYAPPGYPQQ